MKRVISLVIILIVMFTPVMSAGEVDGATVLGQNRVSAFVLTDKEGQGHFFRGGRVDTSFTGVAFNRETGEREYVEKGVTNLSFTGIATSINDGVSYGVVNGKVDLGYSGLMVNPATGLMEYVEAGKRDYAYTGMARSIGDGSNYFVRDGKVAYSFTGLAKDQSSRNWVYVEKGKADPGFTGSLRAEDGRTYSIVDGKAELGGEDSSHLSHRNFLIKKRNIWEEKGLTFFQPASGEYDYLGGKLMGAGLSYRGDGSGRRTIGSLNMGVAKMKNGNYYYINPATGTVRRKEGFIESRDKLYYSEADGKLVKNRLFQVDGKTYGATADGSLAREGWIKVGQLFYNFHDYQVEDTCLKAKTVLDDIGYDLVKAYFWSGSQLPYYTFESNPSWGTKWYADFGYAKEKGNCYVMAATFYYYARMLGYDATQVAGEVALKHSWVEIVQDGEIRVYDPERFYESGVIVYNLTYDAPVLERYKDWEPMPAVSRQAEEE